MVKPDEKTDAMFYVYRLNEIDSEVGGEILYNSDHDDSI